MSFVYLHYILQNSLYSILQYHYNELQSITTYCTTPIPWYSLLLLGTQFLLFLLYQLILSIHVLNSQVVKPYLLRVIYQTSYIIITKLYYLIVCFSLIIIINQYIQYILPYSYVYIYIVNT